MQITIESKKIKELSSSEMNLMNKGRIINFGKDTIKDWKKDYPLNSEVIFAKNKNNIVSFLVLRPIKINYLKTNYNIYGICSVISFEKGRNYGRILISATISFLQEKKKSALGFTNKTIFFDKAGLGTEKEFIKRFVYVNPKTKEKIYDDDGDGIFYNNKDNFIQKVLSTKSIVEIPIFHW